MSAFDVRTLGDVLLDPPPGGAEDGTEPLDLGELNEQILKELERRLGDEKLRQEIPGTTLMQLARDIMKAKEREAAAHVDEREEDMPLSEILAQAGLPAERKRELVRAQILITQAELDRLTVLLDELEAE